MAGNKADAIEKMIPPVAKLASILNIEDVYKRQALHFLALANIYPLV